MRSTRRSARRSARRSTKGTTRRSRKVKSINTKKRYSLRKSNKSKRYLRGGVPVSIVSDDGNIIRFTFEFQLEEPLDPGMRRHIRDVIIPQYLGDQNEDDSFIGFHVRDTQLDPEDVTHADLITFTATFEPGNIVVVKGEIESYNPNLTRTIIQSSIENLPIQLRIVRDGEGDDTITMNLLSASYELAEL
jgi:hypothetical protein